jgi:hypothetical protein
MVKTIRRAMLVAAVAVAVAGLVACGGDSPFAPTSVNGSNVVLHGTVLSLVPALSVGFTASSTGDDSTITVTVEEEPEISASVDSRGQFVLRGLPDGSFTIVFETVEGTELGTLTFDSVLPNQELTISVEFTDGAVVLVEESRNGIGHADLEIQGTIEEAPQACDEDADNLFVIAGYGVVTRPLVTAVRQDNTALSVCDLVVGDQVHVKGAWMELEESQDSADQQVLAHEIKLQDGEDLDGEKITICHKGKNTITISVDAWPAHMAHGDTEGACGSDS